MGRANGPLHLGTYFMDCPHLKKHTPPLSQDAHIHRRRQQQRTPHQCPRNVRAANAPLRHWWGWWGGLAWEGISLGSLRGPKELDWLVENRVFWPLGDLELFRLVPVSSG